MNNIVEIFDILIQDPRTKLSCHDINQVNHLKFGTKTCIYMGLEKSFSSCMYTWGYRDNNKITRNS